MGPVESMVVMEELGRGIVLEPLAQCLIAAGILAGYACADLQAAWLPRVASGDSLVVLASRSAQRGTASMPARPVPWPRPADGL